MDECRLTRSRWFRKRKEGIERTFIATNNTSTRPPSRGGTPQKLLKEERKEIITYCQVRLLLMPSRKRSRNERCRLGPDPEIMFMSLLGDELDDDEFKNLVGLKCC